MPKQPQIGSGLTPGQAVYVLDRLVNERRVSARDVSRMAAEMHQEISNLERRLAVLRAGTADLRAAGRLASGRGL